MALGSVYALLHLVLIWPLGLRLVAGNWSAFARQTLGRGLLPFALGLAVSAALAQLWTVDSWLRLIAIVCAATLAYLAALLAFALDEFDRELLARGLRRLGLRRSRA